MYGNSTLWSVIHRLKFPERKPDHASIEPWAALQRPFVWREEQIARLFDSIMCGFPIGTVLIWRTDAAVKHQCFVSDWPGSTAVAGAEVPQNTGAKDIVLDGHQRLQSLLIGLAGSYNGRELYFDVTSGEETSLDRIRYRFGFKDADAGWPWVRFKDIVSEMSRDKDLPVWSDDPTSAALSGAHTEAERHLIVDNVLQAIRQFALAGDIRFQYLVRHNDDPDRGDSDNYTAEEAAEIFRRINAGSTLPDRLWLPSPE